MVECFRIWRIIKMKWSSEAKVGLVTVVGVILFSYTIIDLAQAEILGKPGYEVHSIFSDAKGVQKGNTVRYAGVNVGRVLRVATTSSGVDVVLKLDKQVIIPKDSPISITTDGLLGEKIINITPGSNKERGLQEGDYVLGTSSKSMDDLVNTANDLIQNTNQMVVNVNRIIGDSQTQAAIRDSMIHINNITAQTDAMLQANAGNIRAIAQNMADLTAQMNSSLQRIDGDGATSDNIRSLVKNMNESSKQLTMIANSFAKVTGDPHTQENLQMTLQNTAAISQKVNQLLSGNRELNTTGEAGILYNNTSKESYGYATFKVEKNNNFFLLGAEGIGNRTKMNLQYGTHRPFFDIRWGLVNGELGGGIDLFPKKVFQLSLEGYNPNQWQYRMKGKYRVSKNVYILGQAIRPMKGEGGGNYFGVHYVF